MPILEAPELEPELPQVDIDDPMDSATRPSDSPAGPSASPMSPSFSPASPPDFPVGADTGNAAEDSVEMQFIFDQSKYPELDTFDLSIGIKTFEQLHDVVRDVLHIGSGASDEAIQENLKKYPDIALLIANVESSSEAHENAKGTV